MRGHWPCRLIEFVLLASRPCRGLFNFAWGGQSIMRDESRRHLPWLPTKTIIAAWRGHGQGVDGQGSADPDYRGTRSNLHHEQQRSSVQSTGAGATGHASAARLIACAWPGNLHPGQEEADWLDLPPSEYFYIDKTPWVIPKGETKCLRRSMFLHLWHRFLLQHKCLTSRFFNHLMWQSSHSFIWNGQQKYFCGVKKKQQQNTKQTNNNSEDSFLLKDVILCNKLTPASMGIVTLAFSHFKSGPLF